MNVKIISVLAIPYLLGNFNSGIVLSKLFYKKDLRRFGSKNPGATNAMRVLGRAAGFLVLFVDAGKGVAAVALAKRLLPGMFWPCLAGLLVVLGHIFPALFQFKGGKGVATTAGVTLLLQPPVLLLELIPFLILLFGLRYMSLASVACGLLLPIITFLWRRQITPLFWMSLILGLLIVFTHRENIKRLIRREEKKLF